MDAILVLLLIGLLIAALPPRSYKSALWLGEVFLFPSYHLCQTGSSIDRRPTLGLWNEGAVPTLFAMTEALPTV
jgi:hypothetical protein